MTIRSATHGDAAAIHAIYAPFVAETPVSFELEVPSASEIAARIARTVERTPWLVDDRDGTIAGYAYATKHRDRAAYQWAVDVSAYVAAGYRRQGVARALYGALFERLLRQGYLLAHAGIALPNPASVGLHEALGFKLVGVYPRVGFKLGVWHDVGWWQLELADRPAAPAPPRTPGGTLEAPALRLPLSRSVLRPWRSEDREALVASANNPDVSGAMTDRFPSPYTARDAQDWLELQAGIDPPRNLAIEVDGIAVGGIGIELFSDVRRRSAEIGYWLGQPCWGRGIATEALVAMTDHAFATFDICRLQATVFSSNPRSARVLEKAGYVLEGTLRNAVTKRGETLDMWLYALVR